ncbi:MAG TPA: hypothetical protein VGZ04_10675 [Acidimicrobiales bacterium]|nr:hypothetical protein [Acidimicrobiales bacterium]
MTDQHEHNEPHQVVVHDEDDGNAYRIDVVGDELVRTVVEILYEDKLHRERRADDRLRCEANGEDVFAHEHELLREYRERFCHALVWLFAGGQGGAEG